MAGSEVQTFNMDHHGIIAGMCKDLGLKEKIDQRIHKGDPRRVVSPGMAVVAMILNGLGFSNRRLYLTPQFFEHKPIDKLFGGDFLPSDFDDHTLGKALDEIAKYGVSQFFGEIAFEIAAEQNILGKSAHNDTTTFSVEGNYEGGKEGCIEVTHGYSKDGRKDLKQIVMNLVTTGAASIPIWMSPRSGNASDSKSLQDTIDQVKSFQKQFKLDKDFRWVMDAAWYNKENLNQISENFWISRVPETIKEAKNLVECREEELNWKVLENGYKIDSIASQYGGISQRWIIVYSDQAYEREKKTFLKRFSQKREQVEKSIWHLSCKVFDCEKDAEKALKDFTKKIVGFKVSAEIEEIKKYQGRGRPNSGVEKEISGYRIRANFIDDEDYINSQLNSKGRFILATNDININGADVLTEYKEQKQVEHGFRFLKDPWFMVDSFFLKSIERITALMAVMALCLMVYNLAQYRLRKALTEQGETIPNQLKKPVKNPTLRWIFQIMEGVSIVKFYDDSFQKIREVITNLNVLRKQIVRLLGPTTRLIYGIS